MEQLTQNVYTVTDIRGCNPSIVFTSEGSIFIDTAQWIGTLMEMREFALEKGPIKYLINTEPHIDHIFGNHWFANESVVIAHEQIEKDFFLVPGEMDGYDYSVDVIKRQDPDNLHLMPSREDYIINKPQITFNDHMTIKLGDHTFELYHTPGHSDSQICVHVPEERVLFVGDTFFVNCQTWLHSADIAQLKESLEFIKTFDVDYVVPGHGPVTTTDFADEQLKIIDNWIEAVREAKDKGWDLETCKEKISFAQSWAMDIGQDESMDYVQVNNVVKCFDYINCQDN